MKVPEYSKPPCEDSDIEDDAPFEDKERLEIVKTLLFRTHKLNTDVVVIEEF